MVRPRLFRALVALLAILAAQAGHAQAAPWLPVNPVIYLQVDQDLSFQQFLKNLAQTDPDRITNSIHFDNQTSGFTVTLWDGEPVPVTQADLRTIGVRKNAPLWPSILKIAEAKRREAGLSGKPLTG